MAEIDVRAGQQNTISAIRFHDSVVIKQADANTLSVTNNTGTVLVSIPKATIDAFISALQASKKIFP